MTKLSIVIVSWNTCELLARCLQSVSEELQSREPFAAEIFVVDNASTDGTAAMVREGFPQVRCIVNHENLGFARANNQAIRESSGRYVLLLNPDTELQTGALEALLRFIDGHPDVGVAGARLLNPDGTLQVSSYPMPTLSRELWRLFHLDVVRPYAQYRMHTWDLHIPREVDMVQGACLLVRREVLEQVGLLDEDYFMYTEEVDLCYRVRQAGWRIYWAPEARVVHYGGQSTQQAATEMFLRLYESKLLFFRKHHGRASALIYKIILAAGSLSRLFVSSLVALAIPHRRGRYLLAANYARLLKMLPEL